MESILNSIKKVLGLDESYTAFDLDVIIHTNDAFSTLNQLGVGPVEGFSISDDTQEWESFVVPDNQLHMVKTYIWLKVRFLFDPPTTSFAIDAMSQQIKEHEWRLNAFREDALPDPEEVSP